MLFVIATPIGNDKDLSQRARETLAACTVVIGEEFREVSTLLKKNEIVGKQLEQLNEHSTPDDIAALLEFCKSQDVALVSDCGTPGFCDPGAELVRACHEAGVLVRSLPGPSSLMSFLSIAGRRLDRFLFLGFLPANREERQRELIKIKLENAPIILMDTPYRLGRLLEELASAIPDRRLIIGMDLTTEQETLVWGSPADLEKKLRGAKREFILLIEGRQSPARSASLARKRSR